MGCDIIPQDGQVTWYDEAESNDEGSMRISYLFPLVVKTDSLSGKMLLEASDLQRKSRHIEIKVYRLRELMDRKVFSFVTCSRNFEPSGLLYQVFANSEVFILQEHAWICES